MEFRVNANYQESVVPPRCRNPRIVKREKEVAVNIKEMTDATFPVAYSVVKDINESNGKMKSFRFELRSDGGQLFTQYTYGYSFWAKNIGTPKPVSGGLKNAASYTSASDLYRDYPRTEMQLDDLVKKAEEQLRIFDGTFWYRTDREPYYSLEVLNPICDPLFYIEINDCDCDRPGNIYRADEKQMLIDRLNALANDCPEELHDIVEERAGHAKEMLKSNYIEVLEPVAHTLPTHKENRTAYLRRVIEEYVSDTIGKVLYSSPEKSERITRFLRDAMFTRLNEEKGRWTDEYITLDKFREALQDTIFKLVTEHDSAAVLITDRNVDGCGTDVSVCVRVKNPTDNSYTKLKRELIKQKDRCAKECLDTDEMVERACNAAFGKGGWNSVCYNSLIDF